MAAKKTTTKTETGTETKKPRRKRTSADDILDSVEPLSEYFDDVHVELMRDGYHVRAGADKLTTEPLRAGEVANWVGAFRTAFLAMQKGKK